MEGLGGWDGLGRSLGASNLAFSNNQPLPAGCLSVLVFPGNLTFSRQPYKIIPTIKKGALMEILFLFRYDINLRIEQFLILRVPISNISNIDSGNF